MLRTRARTWTFAFALAQTLAGDQLLEPGDELGLLWRGELAKPELAPAGTGRRAIVTQIASDDIRPVSVVVALIDEGA